MATASGISPELEQKIKQNTLYSDLPPSIKEVQRSVRLKLVGLLTDQAAIGTFIWVMDVSKFKQASTTYKFLCQLRSRAEGFCLNRIIASHVEQT